MVATSRRSGRAWWMGLCLMSEMTSAGSRPNCFSMIEAIEGPLVRGATELRMMAPLRSSWRGVSPPLRWIASRLWAKG